jgi:hypothetical protein
MDCQRSKGGSSARAEGAAEAAVTAVTAIGSMALRAGRDRASQAHSSSRLSPYRQRGDLQVGAEGQLEHRADQHVLRVADQRQPRADVGRAGQPHQEGKRRQTTTQRQARHQGREGQADHVVGEHRRKQRGHQQQHRQQAARRQLRRQAAPQHLGVEAAQAHLCGQHHEGEQQHQGRQVDRARGVLDAAADQRDHRDGAEQGDAAAVQLQRRQAAEEHADVDHREDRGDRPVGVEGGQGWVSAALCSSIRRRNFRPAESADTTSRRPSSRRKTPAPTPRC